MKRLLFALVLFASIGASASVSFGSDGASIYEDPGSIDVVSDFDYDAVFVISPSPALVNVDNDCSAVCFELFVFTDQPTKYELMIELDYGECYCSNECLPDLNNRSKALLINKGKVSDVQAVFKTGKGVMPLLC